MAESILQILSEKSRARVAAAIEKTPLQTLRNKAEQCAAAEKSAGCYATTPTELRPEKTQFPFEAALRKPGLSFICEVKKASPSKGIIAHDFPYLDIAKDYENGGAQAISVLTEPEYFMGRLRYLREISEAVNIPTLRKDFIINEYQIYEAKICGAAAVLLIVSILTERELSNFIKLSETLGMSALVEAHTADEIKIAANAGVKIIGVNNRNLNDFSVDTDNAAKLRAAVPAGILFVSESGIKNGDDIRRIKEIGADAVLVGESLMRAENPIEFLRELKSYAN
jgi:indole-3-glycerol phosphate synthase